MSGYNNITKDHSLQVLVCMTDCDRKSVIAKRMSSSNVP